MLSRNLRHAVLRKYWHLFAANTPMISGVPFAEQPHVRKSQAVVVSSVIVYVHVIYSNMSRMCQGGIIIFKN